MLKFLLTVVIVVVALRVWFGKGRRAAPSRRSASTRAPQVAQPLAMVACTRCGVHLPAADAFLDDQGRRFCGAEHRRLGPS